MKSFLLKYKAIAYAIAAIALAQVPSDKLDTIVAATTKLAAIVATVKAATSTAPKDHEAE